MNYHTKIFALLFGLQSLISFSALPNAAAPAAGAGAGASSCAKASTFVKTTADKPEDRGAEAQQKEAQQLRDENESLRQKIAAAIAALENPNSRLIESSGVKAVSETLEPIEQLRELLKKFYDANFATTNNLKLRNGSVSATMSHLKHKHVRSADHKAFFDKNDAIVAFIEKHKAAIKEMRSSQGETALMLCTQYGSKAGRDKLIDEIGMDIFTVDNEGRSILFYCISPYFYPESVIYFARKMQKTHQHLIEDAISCVPLADIVDIMWPFLTRESKIQFVHRCDWNHKAYKNIKKEFPALKKQSQDQKNIAQMGAEVAREFAQPSASSCAQATEDKAALTPEQIAKLETQKAAQLRRKENRRKRAEEENAQRILALQKKEEQEKLAAALEEKRTKEKEREAELNAQADTFAKTHEPARNAQKLRHAFEYWKDHYAARKQQELDNQKLADEHHRNKKLLIAVNSMKQLAARQKELYKKADAMVQRKALRAWHTAQRGAQEELNLRLTACENAFDIYQHIKNKKKSYYSSKDNKELEDTAIALELGRAQINLLSSGQRIVRLYAQRGYTNESFNLSKKPYDLAALKLLHEIEKHIGKEYAFGPNVPMIEQLFKNCSARKETQEEEQAYRLFDAVRARNIARVTQLLAPSLRSSEHGHLNTFRHWLRAQGAQIPANAMIHGHGIRDIFNAAHVETQGKPVSLIKREKVIESLPRL